MDSTILCALISLSGTVAGLIITPLLTSYLSNKKAKQDRLIAEEKSRKEQDKRDRHQDELFQMMIGSQVKQLCHYAIQQQSISLEDLEHIHSLYHKYKELDGNGFIDTLLSRVNGLPIVN